MFPEEFIKRISDQDHIDRDGLLRALSEPSPVSIRINPRKWDYKPAGSEPVPWCKSGYYLSSRPSYTLDPLFHSGCYYPQEASGMFIERIFENMVDATRYLKVLDLCGAPGGKSTHLSSLIGQGSLLVSNEVIKPRAEILKDNIIRWGGGNTLVTRNDPSAFKDLTGFFDIILADVPCSGEGMFRDRIAVDEWSVKNTLLCSERQKRIIADVWPALSPDGILIYSTCTFNPAENEENIKWITETEDAASVPLDINGPEGITVIDYKGVTGYAFYPDSTRGEGFFISVVRKKEGSGRRKSGSSARKTYEVRNDDRKVIERWTHFDPENIIRRSSEFYSVPGKREDFIVLDSALNITSPGTRICSVKNNGYIPDHQLALSTGIRNIAFASAGLDYRHSLAFLRKEPVDPGTVPKGWFLATYKGVNLGFGNNIGSRINNYFPVSQRIRMDIPEDAEKSIIMWEMEETKL